MTRADGYLDFLLRRDGEADVMRRTLSRREVFFTALAADPVRSSRPVDRASYARNVARRRPERGLAAETLWLVATAKANQAERFGVGLADLYGRVHAESDPVRVHIQLQEFYHTRILADAVSVFGLSVRPLPPAAAARLIVQLIVRTPEAWHLPLTGCAEMVGCVVFRALRDLAGELFGEEPRVAARLRLLYDEILADEIGHVGFIASLLPAWKRAVMRGLYRRLGPRLVAQFPELIALAGPAELRRRLAAFSLPAMVAELPGIAYAAATP